MLIYQHIRGFFNEHKSVHRCAQICARFFVLSKCKHLIEFFNNYLIACCRVGVIVERCLQLPMPCLSSDKIRIKAVVQQQRDISLTQFVRRASAEVQFIAHPVEFHLDVAFRNGIEDLIPDDPLFEQHCPDLLDQLEAGIRYEDIPGWRSFFQRILHLKLSLRPGSVRKQFVPNTQGAMNMHLVCLGVEIAEGEG